MIGGNEKTDSPVPDDLSASLGDLTLKKKKKKAVKSLDAADFEQQLEQAGLEDIAPTSSKTESTTSATEAVGGLQYEDLLSRFFSILKKNNPELAGDKSGPKFRIPPPVCQREGSKKTLFANVQQSEEICSTKKPRTLDTIFVRRIGYIWVY